MHMYMCMYICTCTYPPQMRCNPWGPSTTTRTFGVPPEAIATVISAGRHESHETMHSSMVPSPPPHTLQPNKQGGWNNPDALGALWKSQKYLHFGRFQLSSEFHFRIRWIGLSEQGFQGLLTPIVESLIPRPHCLSRSLDIHRCRCANCLCNN